jgi:aspartate racemase
MSAGTLGILGGMGPLASAAFIETVYRLNLAEPEQRSPVCILYSDPGFPDRTEAILAGRTAVLARRLTTALGKLVELGADRIVIACITIHHLLPNLPVRLRERVISLVDLVVDEVLRAPRPLLLLTTNGTRAAAIFERHERWRHVAPWVARLDDDDQAELHARIYGLKANRRLADCIAWLDWLLPRYGGEGFLFGCTDLHILHRELAPACGGRDDRVVDPLLIAARDLSRLLSTGDRAPSRSTGGAPRRSAVPEQVRSEA